MYKGTEQSVLRCDQCKKPFDKSSTLKRHGYYCRSRRGAVPTRLRACTSCVRSKARCDNGLPECSRCMVRGIECHYPTDKLGSNVSAGEHGNDVPTKRRKVVSSTVVRSPAFEQFREVSNHINTVPAEAAMTPGLDFADFDGTYPQFEELNIDFADVFGSQEINKTMQMPLSVGPPMFNHSISVSDEMVQLQQTTLSPLIPPTPSCTLRSIIRRPKMKSGVNRIADLILCTLKSYPLMMMRHDVLPPFVHAHSALSDTEEDQTEAMDNCVSLVHMISHGVRGCRKLFWKNVRLECERMRAESSTLNKWQLLAAMQALSIYVLIRLDEGETEYNNFDLLLITTVTIIATKLNSSDTKIQEQSTRVGNDLKMRWRDWIFEESKRRLCVVYQVVNLLAYFEPAAMCDVHATTGLFLAPLPGKKQLWEASDEFSWKAELDRDNHIQPAFGLATDGELAKIGDDEVHRDDRVLEYELVDTESLSRSTANWEEWCSGMDSFGGLVMLAASLIA